MKNGNYKPLLYLILAVCYCQTLSAQDVDSLYNLSLEELMNIPIQSASKKKETLFNAPLSSYTITAQEIERSGATNIPEALKLAPGVIVREQTNGVYDVAIRGLDNLTEGDVSYSSTNLTTLVMVDNRPIFNHNLGGTFWETIPVDLADVERIEIVRGPSAPLFGPNAVSGVINIITKQLGDAKQRATVRAIGASPLSPIASAFYSTALSSKTSLNLSANYQTRERWSDSKNMITTPSGNPFVSTDQVDASIKANFPDINQSVKRLGLNTALNFKPSDNVHVNLSGGYQNSGAQKVFVANSNTNLGWNETSSGYLNLATQISKLNFRGSYWAGKENLSYHFPPGRYKFNVTDLSAEYEIKVGTVGTIVPGVSYVNAVFDDTDYKNNELVYFGQKASINTQSAYLRTDWNLTEQWRFIAAARADKFSKPDVTYVAYEFASTYTLNNKSLVRVAVTRSNSGSFVGKTSFLNYTLAGLEIHGSDDTKLFTVNMIELGYRNKLSDKLQLDIDIFKQDANKISAFLVSNFVQIAPGIFVPTFVKPYNTNITATQYGGTLSLNFVANENFQFKPFITIQSTKADNIPDSFVHPSTGIPIKYSKVDHKSSPSVFGGWYADYQSGKWNFNLSGYYLGGIDIYKNNLNILVGSTDPSVPTKNEAKLLLNARVGYSVSKTLSVFALGKNILNQKTREFSYGDQIGSLVGFGINANFSK